MTPAVKKLWPRGAVGPNGNRAMFYCLADVPAGWRLERPLPGDPAPTVLQDQDDPPKRKPGRPRKVVPDA